MHLIMLDLSSGRSETLKYHEHPLRVGAAHLWHLTVEEFVLVFHIDTGHVHAGYSLFSGSACVFGTDLPHKPQTGALHLSHSLGTVPDLARRVSVELLWAALKEEFTVALCDMGSSDVSGIDY